MTMHLELADSKTRYRPGETIEGVAFWELAQAPQWIEVRLFWQTRGKGTVDLEAVRVQRFTDIALQDRRPFRLALPAGPFSVSGKLVSIVWGIEVVSEPHGESANVELVVSPTGEEIRLEAVEVKKKK